MFLKFGGIIKICFFRVNDCKHSKIKPFQITFGFPKPPNFGPSEIYGTSVHFRVLGLINKHSIQKISFRYSTPTPLLVVAMVYI